MTTSPTPSKKTEWALPIAAVVLLHLGLLAIPIQFSEAHSEQPPPVELSMVEAPDMEPPPTAVETPQPEAQPEPEPEPEPPIEANEPEPAPVESEVAVAEEPPPVEEPTVDEIVEEEVEELPEDSEPVEEVVERPDVDEVLDLNPLDTTATRPEAQTAKTDEDAEPVDWQGYGRNVMQAVQSEKNYPRMATRMGWEGTATVRITIDRHGELALPPDIVDSSDHDALDDEVLRMVESAAPFERFPSTADEEEQELVIPVRFELRS